MKKVVVHYLKEGESCWSKDDSGRYKTECGERRQTVTIDKSQVTCPDCKAALERGKADGNTGAK